MNAIDKPERFGQAKRTPLEVDEGFLWWSGRVDGGGLGGDELGRVRVGCDEDVISITEKIDEI